LTAVATDASGATFVWVLDAQSRAERREVRTGAIRGGDITIATGLAPGERIVAAGVSALRAGMQVRPLDPAEPGIRHEHRRIHDPQGGRRLGGARCWCWWVATWPTSASAASRTPSS
jgi:hypothetical protein